jgi:hypothetical protein
MRFLETDRFKRTCRKFSAVLTKVGLQHALIGGNAVDYWANPPATHDIDIVARLDYTKILSFVDAIQKHHPEIVLIHKREPSAGTLVLYYVDQKERIRVDLITSDHPVFDWSVREAFVTDDLPLPVVRPENLVLSKFIAGRPKDIRGIQAILRGRVREAVNWSLVARRLSMMRLLRDFNRKFGLKLSACKEGGER